MPSLRDKIAEQAIVENAEEIKVEDESEEEVKVKIHILYIKLLN